MCIGNKGATPVGAGCICACESYISGGIHNKDKILKNFSGNHLEDVPYKAKTCRAKIVLKNHTTKICYALLAELNSLF